MSHSEELLKEFDQEMQTTRRVLERVPGDNPDWKPHPKSFSIAHLAQLVSGMPGWITNILTESKLDLSKGGGYSNQTPDALLANFDKVVTEARATIAAAKDEDYEPDWSLTHGDRVLVTQRRKDVVRQTINHLSHHRGQLTVYLRLLDIPVPSIYGPTADEGWG
jgi:uncharacterized damage-inducible protein DinB